MTDIPANLPRHRNGNGNDYFAVLPNWKRDMPMSITAKPNAATIAIREYLKASEWLVKTGKVETMTPTREQIATTIHSVACPDCWIGSKYDLDIADALLREYEIRERETLQIVGNALAGIEHDAMIIQASHVDRLDAVARISKLARAALDKLYPPNAEIRVKEEKNG